MLGVVPDDDPDYGDRAGWLTIPYITPYGGVVDLRFRRPPGSESKAKYKSLPGSQHRLYNPSAILTASTTIVLNEGEGDVWTTTQAGFHSIGIPGASAWSSVFAKALEGFEHIVVCEDGDDDGAGAGLTGRIVKDLDWAKVVRFEGHDATSFALEHGSAALWGKISAAVSGDEEDTDEEG